MAILVLGASGFIGRHVAGALEAAGYGVLRGSRTTHDFARHQDALSWAPALAGCEAVVNAAGIFHESREQGFEIIHARGPMALFEACTAAGIPVVQVSALGAHLDAPAEFLRSKARADAHLLALPVPSLVIQPSLVFGPDGASARLFATLASLPVMPVPDRGLQQVQPVHVADLAEAIVHAIRDGYFPRARLAAVGPAPLALREYLGQLRAGLGLGRALIVPMPTVFIALAARLGLGWGDRDALRMLDAGNIADPAGFTRLLGHEPRDARHFIGPHEAGSLRTQAAVTAFAPVLRLALAFMWFAAALVSVGIFPVEDSLALLRQVGLAGGAAKIALYGASALDWALGLATLLVRRRIVWSLQFILVVGYTAIITVFLPEQWLHPFGPVVKNIPLLAAILLLRALERR